MYVEFTIGSELPLHCMGHLAAVLAERGDRVNIESSVPTPMTAHNSRLVRASDMLDFLKVRRGSKATYKWDND